MVALGLAAALALAASSPECSATDDDGSTFPTCFDPGNGLEVGVGGAFRAVDAPGNGAALEIRAGILLRSERESRSKRGSSWFSEQRLLMVRTQPLPQLRDVTFTLFEGIYRRHLKEGFILVPTRTPTRLPFPFDLALYARAGTVERRVFDGPGAHFEVGRAALLLDPVRSESGRFHAAFGPAMSYGLRTDGKTWTHELSPFSSAMLDVGAESEDGWWRTRALAVAGWVAVPRSGTFFRASAEIEVERLVFAVNDQPLWLNLSVRAAHRDAGVYRATELVGTLGLVLRAFQ